MQPQFVEKALLFHKLKPYLKWKRGLGPLFQAFFPLQPRFFLNKAAVFRHSQAAWKNIMQPTLSFIFSVSLGGLV